MKIYEVNTYEAVIQQNVKPAHVFLQTKAGNLAAGVTVNLFRNLEYAPRIILAEPEIQIAGYNQLSIKNQWCVKEALILIGRVLLVELSLG